MKKKSPFVTVLKRSNSERILLALILCLTLAVFPLETFALDHNVDTEVLTGNIKQIYEYVDSHGYVNSDGCREIKVDSNSQISKLTHTENQLVFSFENDENNCTDAVVMNVDIPFSNYMTVNVHISKVEEESGTGESGGTTESGGTGESGGAVETVKEVTSNNNHVDPSDYEYNRKSIHFELNSSNVPDNTAQDWCNQAFDEAFDSWDSLLDSKMDMSVVNLGFSNECNHKYHDIVPVREATCTQNGEGTRTCEWCGHIKEHISIPAAHKWNSSPTIDKPATYLAEGTKSIHCSVCGEIKEGSTEIIPKLTVKGTTLNKPTALKKGFQLKWKKRSGVTGYEIQYALNKKFTSGKKTIKVSKAATVSKKVTKLKANKKYYIRIRTYKVEDGKSTLSKPKTYYSSWSKIKTVKTK